MGNVALRNLRKGFGRARALDGIELDLQEGEFLVLTGPAGAGKSTLLRLIAGLEAPDAGTIEIDGEIVNGLAPRQRDVAMVFQNGAPLPSRSVFDNIAFALKAGRVHAADIAHRVERIADLIEVGGLLGTRADRLAPPRTQLVAIARALVRDAAVCLLDDPLASLDAQLREATRTALAKLHRAYPVTKLLATRDPVEAMTLADRVAVLHEGKIEQDGAPLEVFERPATLFVARFFGSPPMNLLPGTLARAESGDAVKLDGDGPTVPLPPGRLPKEPADGLSVLLGVRPEHMTRAVRISPQDGTVRHEAEIEVLQPVGPRAYATFRMAGVAVIAELQAHDATRAGERIPVDINIRRASVFDAATGKAL